MALRTSSTVHIQWERADVGIIPTQLPVVMLPSTELTPGCKALVLRGPQTGNTVTCIKHIGIPTLPNIIFEVEYDCWEVDAKMPWANPADTVTLLNIFPSKYLMRIDGHQADESDQVHKILEKST